MRNLFEFAALGAVLGMAACGTTGGSGSTTGSGSSSSTAGATGTGTGTGSGGGSSSGGSSTGSSCGNGNACSSLANGASVTYVVQIASVAPTPAGGGAPHDGTYFLTSASTYTGEGGAKGKTTEARQDTIQISGSGTELNQASSDDSCPASATGSLLFGTTQVTLATTCPAGGGGTIGYTSSPMTLTLFMSGKGSSSSLEVQVYTLQQ